MNKSIFGGLALGLLFSAHAQWTPTGTSLTTAISRTGQVSIGSTSVNTRPLTLQILPPSTTTTSRSLLELSTGTSTTSPKLSLGASLGGDGTKGYNFFIGKNPSLATDATVRLYVNSKTIVSDSAYFNGHVRIGIPMSGNDVATFTTGVPKNLEVTGTSFLRNTVIGTGDFFANGLISPINGSPSGQFDLGSLNINSRTGNPNAVLSIKGWNNNFIDMAAGPFPDQFGSVGYMINGEPILYKQSSTYGAGPATHSYNQYVLNAPDLPFGISANQGLDIWGKNLNITDWVYDDPEGAYISANYNLGISAANTIKMSNKVTMGDFTGTTTGTPTGYNLYLKDGIFMEGNTTSVPNVPFPIPTTAFEVKKTGTLVNALSIYSANAEAKLQMSSIPVITATAMTVWDSQKEVSIKGGENYLTIGENNQTSTTRLRGNILKLEAPTTTIDGKVSIGNFAGVSNPTPAGYSLYVREGILTTKVRIAAVNTADWSDYVFSKDYKLRPLKEVSDFVRDNKHLPGVPSADEVSKNGIDIAKMDAKLLEKIEELTLYLIEQNKKIESMQAEIDLLKK